ncbi:MAG: 2Fe-2S iron-sulfur cluster binding domain-containing protein, partial [Blastocatellia bacterium]|nr:2Fe-2S iron-sulfur cluster binding domain-containing protein [Blastocatellia bacterium]
MATINYRDEIFSVEANETVLETLLKKGVKVTNACRAGVCQSCILKADKACLPKEAQQGLKETLKTQGYFLSCVYRPQEDLTIVSSDLQIPAYIADKEMLNQDVLCLKLKYEDEFLFQAGQFINLIREDGLARPYSIASLPSDGYLALHIRLIANGQMSGWLSSQAKIGEKL